MSNSKPTEFTKSDRLKHGTMHFICILRCIKSGKTPKPFVIGLFRTFFTWKY